jgi:flagellar biosynthesis protein FliR
MHSSLLNSLNLSAQDYIFYFLILCRFLGMFLISPLLANRAVTTTIRLYLAIFSSLVMALAIYPDYRGVSPKYLLDQVIGTDQVSLLQIGLGGLKELIIGYLIGFVFNIVFESLLLAGELIDNMIGFSTAQFLDPFSNTFQSLTGRLLVLVGVLVMLVADFHHQFFRLTAESFSMIPLGSYHLPSSVLQTITYGTSQIFTLALKLSVIPIVLLIAQLIGIAFTVRVVPELNLFVTGGPVRILVGICSLILAIGYIIPLFEQSFLQMGLLADRIVSNLALIPASS